MHVLTARPNAVCSVLSKREQLRSRDALHHGLRAGVGRGGVAGGADHEDRRRAGDRQHVPSVSPLAGLGMPTHDVVPHDPPHGGSSAWNRTTSASSLAVLGARFDGPVDAADHRVGLDQRVPGAGGVTAEVPVGDRQQARRLTLLHRLGERVGEDRPSARPVVEHREHTALEQAGREHALAGDAGGGVRRRERLLVDAGDELLQHVTGRAGRRQRAGGLLAPVEERAERVHEPAAPAGTRSRGRGASSRAGRRAPCCGWSLGNICA